MDEILKDIMSRTPLAGEIYLRGNLRSSLALGNKEKVENFRSGRARAARRSFTIQRRVYNVQGTKLTMARGS